MRACQLNFKVTMWVGLLVQARAFRSKRCQNILANLKAQKNMVKKSPTKLKKFKIHIHYLWGVIKAF
jgi:hypothetical protein